MDSILVLGAGKSSVYLIEYLIAEANTHGWKIIVADNDPAAALEKTGGSPIAEVTALDIHNSPARKHVIARATIVISLLPPTLHYFVALDCLEFGKHLFTASYIDDDLEKLRQEVEAKNILFLCELGLDPGIDHMSAMQMIDDICKAGGKINSFKSHCGGLVAPESDDNPWHYKISWNPRNVVLAGQAGAVYKEAGEITHLAYQQLFKAENTVEIPELGELCWYANRNSLPYMELYGLESCETFLRTTLRYPEFCLGWKTLVDLKLTDQSLMYDTDGMTLQRFFKLHFAQNGFAEWLETNVTSGFRNTTDMLQKIERLISLDEDPPANVHDDLKKFMLIDDRGQLNTVGLDEIKIKAAEQVAWQKHEASLLLKQLIWLGMSDDESVINKGNCSAADVLQFALEQKLSLNPGDRDMVVMLHEIGYELGGKIYEGKASLIVKGEDHIHTAMAKTVGLPLAVAASLFLQGKIKLTGLHIPVLKEIYEPVLSSLKRNSITFTEMHAIVGVT
jgi:saccharopine dehydrogenase-like NADP-dependent oxidoreductase